MENVTVENVSAVNTGNALFIRLGHRNQQLPPGSVRHVIIRGLKVEVPAGKPDKGYEMEGPEMSYAHNPFPASIVGIPGHPVEDVVLDNVEVVYKGTEDKNVGRYGLDSLGFVPENESAYPEYSMFGELPAWGLYVRHVSGLQLRKVTLRHPQESFRPAMIFDDVKGVSLDNVREAGAQ